MPKQTKLNWMKWVPADWLNDTRELSPEAKACWIDMICLMWNSPERGRWKGTYEQFARATGIPWEIAPRVITELSLKTSRVTIRDKEVTLKCRRILKTESTYKDHAKRQSEYRMRHASDKKVTRQKSPEVSRIKNTPTAGGVVLGAYKPPEKDKDPVGALVFSYKLMLGVGPEDRTWDKQFWGRWSKQAKIILESMGSFEEALGFLKYHAAKFEEAKLKGWTLMAVASKAVLWSAKEKQKHATANSQRLRSDDDSYGRHRQSEPGREQISIGPILDSLGDRILPEEELEEAVDRGSD